MKTKNNSFKFSVHGSLLLGFLVLLHIATSNTVFLTIFSAIPIALFIQKNLPSTSKRSLKTSLIFVIIILYALFVSVTIRLFIIDIYSIPSTSMENTILQNDRIIVRKDFTTALSPWIKNKFKSRHYNYGSIIVFNRMEDLKITYVKRIIGLPGDELSLQKSIVLRNGKKMTQPEKALFSYRVQYKELSALDSIINAKINRKVMQKKHSSKNTTVLFLTETEKDLLKPLEPIEDIRITNHPAKQPSKTYPKSEFIRGGRDNIEKFIVPKQGLRIKLTKKTIAWYTDIIKFENKNCSVLKNSIILNNKELKSYMFSNNYYYVLGDNRHESQDSRSWGFVKQDLILGEVIFTLHN